MIGSETNDDSEEWQNGRNGMDEVDSNAILKAMMAMTEMTVKMLTMS